MLVRFGYEITVHCWEPTAMVTLLQIREGREADIRWAQAFTTDPLIDVRTGRDLFGNACCRFVAPPCNLTLRSDAIMEVSDHPEVHALEAEQHAVDDLPDACLGYLLGSRYCETDRLSQLAWDLFGHIPPGWARVQAISDFAHARIAFDYQEARSTRTAHDAYHERKGVCRDFAHLAIALCRCMNIPARYVNGYLGDIEVPLRLPMDFSAWLEVYLGGEWRPVDPRNNMPRIGRIPIAHGRDAADVAMITSFAPHALNHFHVWAEQVWAPDYALAVHA
ncbi:MAG TPA: transglutaminase family protein [Caulobacteraceae bacterium]|nr:transglutaminase family protein [Caulobacteraceae bacterium]